MLTIPTQKTSRPGGRAASPSGKGGESPPPVKSQRKENREKTSADIVIRDEHGLPRFPDGRRSVAAIHAPWYLEHASHVVPWLGLATFLFLSDVFKKFAISNIAIHLLIFIPTVHIPAFMTGKMSYIDLSWPLGLLSMGLQVWFFGTASILRRGVVGLEYFLIGLRMTVFVLSFWNVVRKGSELTRYQYRRIVWEEKPFLFGFVTNTAVSMQMEICEQWVWNVSWMCLPAMLHAFDTETSLSALEIFGHGIWVVAFACETIADKQKLGFINKCMKAGEEVRLRRTGGKVCDVGLWRYTRHPNYFFQWAGWVGITVSCIPALLRLWGDVTSVAGIAFAVLLFYVPVGSYLMMVYYTGSIPMEVYTVQTRPSYAEYQKTTNMFFPAPPRVLSKKDE